MIAVNWNQQLNQIFVGCADAAIVALYDPEISRDGIIKCVTKQERRRVAEGRTAFSMPVVTPALWNEEDDEKFQRDLQSKKMQDYAASVPYVPPEVYDA